MKLIAVAVTALLAVGCSSTGTKVAGGVNPGEVESVKEQRLSTDFKREGIRITYTLGGKVEKVEAFGYAEVWKGQYREVAESDAKTKLTKFLYGELVDNQRRVQIISKAIERNQDNTINKFRTVDGTVNISDEDIEKAEASANPDENSKNNTAVRKASMNSAQRVSNTTTITTKGRLVGVVKDRGETLDEGKTYRASYVWTPDLQKASQSIVNQMNNKQ